ncbi:hypothetical protein BJ912DRAFT_947636, partial [Pholiota molesta]
MRQDQLVIQMFTLMVQLLRKENLDLKLSHMTVSQSTPLERQLALPGRAPRGFIVHVSHPESGHAAKDSLDAIPYVTSPLCYCLWLTYHIELTSPSAQPIFLYR